MQSSLLVVLRWGAMIGGLVTVPLVAVVSIALQDHDPTQPSATEAETLAAMPPPAAGFSPSLAGTSPEMPRLPTAFQGTSGSPKEPEARPGPLDPVSAAVETPPAAFPEPPFPAGVLVQQENATPPARRRGGAVFWSALSPEQAPPAADVQHAAAQPSTDIAAVSFQGVPPDASGPPPASAPLQPTQQRFEAAPAQQTDPAAVRAKRFAVLERRLQAIGATHYRLETWGLRGELFRFSCLMEVSGRQSQNRYFEATDADPYRVIELVLSQMNRHIGLLTDTQSAEAWLGRRVRFVGIACGYQGSPRIQTNELSVYCAGLEAWPEEVWGRTVEATGILVRSDTLASRTNESGHVSQGSAGGDFFLHSIGYTLVEE